MSVVSIAIILSFHLKDEPSDFELRMALPLGIVFWCLGLLCLVLGFGNYVKTMTLYSKRVALVQSGWKTQTVSPKYPGGYRVGADGGLDIWIGGSEYSSRVHPVPGYEFDKGFMISRDKLMSYRLAFWLRRFGAVGIIHAREKGYYTMERTIINDWIYRTASRAIYPILIALGTKNALW